jgi:quercetin dioxygenase-like cupin family protein
MTPAAYLKPASPVQTVAYDGVALIVYNVNTGWGLPKHSHNYAHLVMCHAGSIKVSNERRSLTMTKDTQPVNLKAGEWHEIEALEDGTVFVNVFAEGKV